MLVKVKAPKKKIQDMLKEQFLLCATFEFGTSLFDFIFWFDKTRKSKTKVINRWRHKLLHQLKVVSSNQKTLKLNAQPGIP